MSKPVVALFALTLSLHGDAMSHGGKVVRACVSAEGKCP